MADGVRGVQKPYLVQGRVIRGEASVKRSRYPEDVLINNHTSVWGSWWSKGSWGYACCQQTTKNSYCTGDAGLESAAQAQELMDANLAHRLNTSDPAEERNGTTVRTHALDILYIYAVLHRTNSGPPVDSHRDSTGL